MAEVSLRFGVSDGANMRAATWKCWTNSRGDPDVYLTCRETGRAMKTSLHATGRWHHAYTESFFEENLNEEDKTEYGRFIRKWGRPLEIAPGFTLAFRVVTPLSSISSTIDEKSRKKIVWIPSPAEGKANETALLIVTKDTPFTDWPGKRSMNNQLVGSFPLPNGDAAWIVSRDIELPDFSSITGKVNFFKGFSKDNLQSDGLRMHILGKEPDGSWCIYDCVGGYKPTDK
jgi:hypothetical protein